jgi:hypothetical protein
MAPQWRPSQEQQIFIRQYSKAVSAGNAAIFAGAGLSRSAGYVDWKGLLKEIAEELGLSIDKESDLIGVAQYYLNKKQNRSRLNEILIEQFTRETEATPNHDLIARLPIQTIWTTNYDTLIEQALSRAGKTFDIKLTKENLAQTRTGRDVVLYKMHGTVEQPHDAILTKEDYETYERKRPLFSESLKGDLISKTFLFLGMSFTDPNIDYILSRVRVLLDQNQREHFAVMCQPPRPPGLSGSAAADFDYEQRKMALRVTDLRRYAIEPVMISEYTEIEQLLRAISMHVHRNNVLVSGSAREYSVMNRDRLEKLCRLLGKRLIEQGYNLISGFGVGIGEHCSVEALRALYNVRRGNEAGRVIIRPFPRSSVAEARQKELNTQHREDLVGRAGSVVFVAGNRENTAGVIELSEGVSQEFEIARAQKRFIIPIGATGYVAKNIWHEAMTHLDIYYPGLDIRDQLSRLADANASAEDLVETILNLVAISAKSREL